jgi:hypothetical protein
MLMTKGKEKRTIAFSPMEPKAQPGETHNHTRPWSRRFTKGLIKYGSASHKQDEIRAF